MEIHNSYLFPTDIKRGKIRFTINKLRIFPLLQPGFANQLCPAFLLFERSLVYKRSYLTWFLTGISKKYNIGIWSSADEWYVENIVQRILPTDIKPEVLWGNNWCTYNPEAGTRNGFYEKRPEQLATLKYKKGSIILIDDNAHNTNLHQGNSILIKPFTGDRTDQELKHLYNYLMALKPESGDWVG